MLPQSAARSLFLTSLVLLFTQNDWIHTLHSRGVEEPDTFVPLFVLSTMGMASGLSLGPELPLGMCVRSHRVTTAFPFTNCLVIAVLTAGMIGSWLGVLCHQSMLQARVMNLTAASAAIGGFFGFPMAGALFVLELPHRMGLQVSFLFHVRGNAFLV